MPVNRLSPVYDTVDRNSRVHAAQINVLKYLISLTVFSIVPFLVYHDFNSIEDLNLAIIFCQIISVSFSMLVPVKMKLIFCYILPIVIVPFEFEYLKTENLKASYFGKTCDHYKDFTLLLLPMFSSLSVYYAWYVVRFLLILFQKWSFYRKKISIVGYVVLFFVNAVILSYFLYLVTFYIFPGYLSFLVRSDVDNFTISVEVSDIFRTNDYVLKPLQPFERTLSWKINHEDSSHTWTSTGCDATFDGDKLPVCRGIYYRVEGEDVDIICQINNTNGLVKVNEGYETNFISFLVFNHFEWNLGKGLPTSSVNASAKIKSINISELTLQIIDLTAENFNHEITLWGLFKKSTDGILKVKFGSFILKKQKKIFKYIHVPQGHIVSLTAIPFYSLWDNFDHLVFHNISRFAEEDITGDNKATCSDIDKGCGPMIHALFNISKIENIFNENTFSNDITLNSIYVSTRLNESGKHTAKSYTCVCENSYGQHTYSILRNHYNASSKKSYMSEIKLPYTFVILPRGLTHYAANKYKELQKYVRKAINEENNNWKDPWKYFADDLRFYNGINNQLQKVIILIILIEIPMIIGILIKVYCIVCVHHLDKTILKPKSPLVICAELHTCISQTNIGNFVVDENVTHDIMIIASDNNYDFVVKNLFPFFKNLGLSVLFPQTDINGGQSNINGYSQAVVSSVMYAVVATTEFENDPWSNNFILSDLILPQMYEQRRNHHRILIIKFNDVNIPRPLRWNEYVTIADWSTRQSDEDNLRTLRNKFKLMTEALLMTENNV
ncbi:uncharacterized protein LOC127726520 [Mytilus californianus]|uniref:uncharacterized protein LOC127726520 n=1 Tax=Mytilus californianus TaxID=6549 RepID=UPI002247D872|nr:uncharacterized protein LOC127726520 [Mytilus californianus]